MAEIKIVINRTNKLKRLKKKLPKITQVILNDVADATVIDLRKRGTRGEGVSGKLAPLKSETIRQKRKHGLPKPPTPLYGTGRMTQGTFVKERRKNKATIAVPKDREDILSYHQEGAGHLPKREWFGISKKHQKDIEKIARIQFKKLLKTL
jgi:hypothetical protein